jgi:two-component system NarL family sensor kinase
MVQSAPVIERFDDDSERVIAYLRLVAVPLLVAGQVYIPHPTDASDAFTFVMVAFAAYAVAVLAWLSFRPLPGERAVAALTVLDIAAAGALAFTSGGGYSQLRFAFLFAPIAAAFRMRPRLTLAVSAASVAVYLAQALTHPSRHAPGWSSFVLVQAAYLAWIGAAITMLSYLLARRDRAVERLLRSRQLLVAESQAAEERERKRLSQDLHDDAIQNLLAARHDLEDAADADPDGPEARAYVAVTATIARLRDAISELHPYLLDQAGIDVALSRAGQRAARRGGFELDLRILREERGPNDRVLLRCAVELLTNAASHAHARNVAVSLSCEDDSDVLTVSDDGVGFDPSVLDQRLREGHIGVLSVRERCEALGGDFSVDSAPGRGARFALRLPRAPVAV